MLDELGNTIVLAQFSNDNCSNNILITVCEILHKTGLLRTNEQLFPVLGFTNVIGTQLNCLLFE